MTEIENFTPMFAAWRSNHGGLRSKTHWFRRNGRAACGVSRPLEQGYHLYIPDTPLLECLKCQVINQREHGVDND